MTNEQKEFISKIAPLVQRYAPQYGIKVCSPIIAQAILESAWGTTDKVVKVIDGIENWRHNYFGLKWRNNRCAISNDYFEEWTAEQNKDGSYVNIVSKFCKFKSMEDCVLGYFQWTNISNYSNLKGVTDPETYLKNIKADGYATSLKYVENVVRVIKNYNLTQYDTVSEEVKEDDYMIINVHAGHNPDGKVGCGAVGLIKESTEARLVKNEVIRQLRLLGHTVYDCTVEDGTSQSNVLTKIISKCNEHSADLDISIHFNAGAEDKSSNGKTTGTECYIYSEASKSKEYAEKICKAISTLGFANRGVKTNSNLYILKHTKAPAVLIECCFVDDADDVLTYNYSDMASAIVYGITGKAIDEEDCIEDEEAKADEAETTTNDGKYYRVQVGAYTIKDNAINMQKKLKAAGFDAIITE